jgi:hypothetical protein
MPTGFVLGEGDGTVVVYRWADGLVVVICADVTGDGSNSGSFSMPPPRAKSEGSVSAKDGRKFQWVLESKDGKVSTCSIDGHEYDLKDGKLFLVETRGGKTVIAQDKRDVSAAQPTAEGCREFARENKDVAKLLGKADEK